MKIRNGFVSNSSSSSFLINKNVLSPLQIDQIKNHIEVGKSLGVHIYNEVWDRWDITENEYEIEGNCNMDNFDMREFLEKIGVPDKYIHIYHY